MSKLNEKKKLSGIQKHKIKQTHLAQGKQHLLKAVKNEQLKDNKKHKKGFTMKEGGHVLDRFKTKPKK